MEHVQLSDAIKAKAKKIKLVVMDVDGVLTNGEIFMGEDGASMRAFHALDGLGVQLGIKTGLEFAIISASPCRNIIYKRAKEMGIAHAIVGKSNKKEALVKLLDELNLKPEVAAFIGDDWIDIGAIKHAGLGVCVHNAHAMLKNEADYITQASGGQGAVRELVDLLMTAQHSWQALYESYT